MEFLMIIKKVLRYKKITFLQGKGRA